jgi:hypothetical protein
MQNFDHHHPIASITASARSPSAVLAGSVYASSRSRAIIFPIVALLLLGLAAYFLWIAQTTSAPAAESRTDTQRLAVYNRQVAKLEQQMAGYIAESVETKLKKIEQRLSTGSVGSEEIRDFEELKGQILQLQKYTAGANGNLIDPSRLDHPRLQPTAGSQIAEPIGNFLNDSEKLKYFAYLGFASCSAMALLIGGYWWHQETQMRKLMALSTKLPLLPSPETYKD